MALCGTLVHAPCMQRLEQSLVVEIIWLCLLRKGSVRYCGSPEERGRSRVSVHGQAYPHLRWEPPHAEHAKDVHSLLMTALKAEEGFLRPRLGCR